MLNKDDIIKLLEARFSNDIHTKLSLLPSPKELKDTYKAANRIKKAIDNKEKIAVVGDYDVDGVVSCAILDEFFEDVGVNALIKIPNRFKDGYGLNEALIDEFGDINLIITVDNGINANEAALVCEQKGIDLIITDHHMPTANLPKAHAIVNPKQDDCPFPNVDICGAQVAWYVVAALKDVCGLKDYDLSKFLDLLALAIIADMMELRDLNRAMVRAGLKRINLLKRPCFRAIKDYYGKDQFEFDDISFLIAPLINSAGRMDDAIVSFNFLRAKNTKIADEFFDIIIGYNNSRKAQEKMLFDKTIKEIDENDSVIVTWGEEWHEGVIGIVASRLSKHFKRPAIVFSVNGCMAKGSARSIGRFDILSLIAMQEDILTSFGGHKGAAGLMIDTNKLEDFKIAINNSFHNQSANLTAPNNEILGEISPEIVDLDLIKILEDFEPYGQKNPRPVFEIKDIKVLQTKNIGNTNAHLKLNLQKNDINFEAVFFNYDHCPKIGEVINLFVSVSKNSFRGEALAQLSVKEICYKENYE